MPALRPIAATPKEHFIGFREPHRGFVCEDCARLGGDGPDGRLVAQDTQEFGVEDLEERRACVGRVEVFVKRILPETATLA